jgi:hypothetical protein
MFRVRCGFLASFGTFGIVLKSNRFAGGSRPFRSGGAAFRVMIAAGPAACDGKAANYGKWRFARTNAR